MTFQVYLTGAISVLLVGNVSSSCGLKVFLLWGIGVLDWGYPRP